jgi:hypothetical protein
MYAKLTHNACLNYPEWIKDKQAKLPHTADEDIERAAAAEAAAIVASNDVVRHDHDHEYEYEQKKE